MRYKRTKVLINSDAENALYHCVSFAYMIIMIQEITATYDGAKWLGAQCIQNWT